MNPAAGSAPRCNKLLVAPGCFDGHPPGAEETGFQPLTRACCRPQHWHFGYRPGYDVGIEHPRRASCCCINIPIIADADTQNHGNAVNLVRSVRGNQ